MNVLPTGCQPFPVNLLASISSTRRMHCSSRMHTYISSECNLISHSNSSRGIPSLSTTPSWSKNHPHVQPCVHCDCAHPSLLHQASPGWATNCECDAGRRRLSLLLTTNLSDPIFDTALRVPQTLTRAAERLALSTPRDAFLGCHASLPPTNHDTLHLRCAPSSRTE